ncbi:MAG TPA: DUF1549 and DUF1553 domain-containing protein, partial [Edaphobacter sp.]|nr:DUF1549 and DUF1553 domain-containing protein [Edaphobacter sp.]
MRHRCWAGAFVLLAALALPSAAELDKELAFIGSRAKYWAFQRVVRPTPPQVSSDWVKTPIDAFILKGLQDNQLAPSPALDRTRLIRRVTYDLTGLPPTPNDVAAFVSDKSSNAYENVVDRLLASPHYGERWATKWLDLVRYADTNGFELDKDRPHAWRYREYVISSFNQDKPFTRFIGEQIAGDEMFPESREALVATGYLRAGSEHIVAGNIDPEESRQEVLTEIATNIGQTYLGLTVNCARCHNHKFDPILQADFYRLQAVFAGAKGKDIEIATPAEKKAWETADAAYRVRLKPVEDALAELAKPYANAIREERTAKLEPALRDALAILKEKRTPEQQILAKNAEAQIKPNWDEIVAIMPDDVKAKRARLRDQLHKIELTAPDPLPTAYAFVNTGEPPPQSYVLRMGEAHSRLDPVDPSVPRVVKASFEIPATSPGRRTALATWLVSADNPLTARVIVNRAWQFRMGTGLVRTPNDFGVMGDKPKDRLLLDWLASEFVAQGWSIKRLDRLIVTSNVY